MSKIIEFIGIGKLIKLSRIIAHNGGLKKSLIKLFLTDDLKKGKLVGIDKYGNHYYENKEHPIGKYRWVEYASHFHLNYDASHVPAEWHGWLHYKTEYLPCKDPGRPHYKWMSDNVENLSGTSGQFTPFSTTRPKIIPWKPSKNKRQEDPPKKNQKK